ncbi:MAG: zinc-dependent metalloprotease [Bacteroidota bacterium]
MKKRIQHTEKKVLIGASVVLLLVAMNYVFPFAYLFAGTGNGVDVITHPSGYDGSGGTVTVNVSISPTSPNASQMIVPLENVIAVYNNLLKTSPNISFDPGPPTNAQVDFESVLLHEMGHSIGFAHPNSGTESGLPGAQQAFTKSTEGPDGVFNVNAGADGIIGSADDVRGDDINLNFFKIVDNNPFNMPPSVIDNTTYSRELTDLPAGDSYSTSPNRDVAAALGFAGNESVMKQGTFAGEVQRRIAEDDFVGLKYAQTGVDETEGTADDYVLQLNYIGLNNNGDIVVQFDNNATGFAASSSGGVFIPGSGNHTAITDSNIFFNTGSNWFFNQVTLSDENNLTEVLGLSIYPNPTTNIVTVSNPKLVQIDNITVYDINGRLIFKQHVNDSLDRFKTDVDISELNSGVYIFEINSSSGKDIQQIIKK